MNAYAPSPPFAKEAALYVKVNPSVATNAALLLKNDTIVSLSPR